jgi:hypothetical protein
MPGPPKKPYRIGHISKAEREQLSRIPPRTAPIRGRARFRPVTVIPKASSRWLPQVRDWFNSLEQSPYSAQFQASDWATAVAAAEVYDVGLRSRQAKCFDQFGILSRRLGCTIGDRQQARIAVQRAEADDAADEMISDWHNRLHVVPNEPAE